MSTRLYPLYQRGNPQLRVFLPNFWMKMIRPKEPLPPNMVLFQTSIEMTDYDIKNYLEKIYKVPVIDLRATIMQGKIREAYGKSYLVKEDDYKEALVTMPKEFSFTFPEVVGDEKSLQSKTDDMLKEIEKPVKRVTTKPSWFH